jgi:hypothetical protein
MDDSTVICKTGTGVEDINTKHNSVKNPVELTKPVNLESNVLTIDIKKEDEEKEVIPLVAKKAPAKKRQRVKNMEYENYTDDEKKYYVKLVESKRRTIADTEHKIKHLNNDSVPLRFKVLMSGVDESLKAVAVQKLNQLYSLDVSSTEYFNTKHWIESVCKIPFNIYKQMPVSYSSEKREIKQFLMGVKSNMDDLVYGHYDAKNHIVRLLAQWISNPCAKGMVIGIQGPMGCGKCFAKNTPIMMCDGSIQMVQDVRPGDLLMGDDSTARTVINLGRGQDTMYNIQSDDGEAYVVNSEHILCLKIAHRGIINHGSGVFVASVFDKQKLNVISRTFNCEESANDYIAIQPFSEEDRVVEIRVCDFIQLSENIKTFWLNGYRKHVLHFKIASKPTLDLLYSDPIIYARAVCNRPVLKLPSAVTRANYAQREHFVNLLVTNGESKIMMGKAWVTTFPQSHQVAKDIMFVARSVGFEACMRADMHADRYCVFISSTKPDELLVPITVTEFGPGDYYGFMIDGNERFLLGDFTVTHNTTLVKDGICKALQIPFAFLPLGGANDGCYLEGHSYTYQGATWGKIIDVLIKCKCMNPVLFFDELDKVSDTQRGEEIINILIHLTDAAQNDKFNDKYFTEFEFDLSRSLIIFSYNAEDRVSPILRDRMIKVQTNGYQAKDKITISTKHMIPEMLKEYNFDKDDITFSEENIRFLIEFIETEEGVRNLKRALQDVISNLNLRRLIEEGEQSLTLPHVVTKEDFYKFVSKRKKTSSLIPLMYV